MVMGHNRNGYNGDSILSGGKNGVKKSPAEGWPVISGYYVVGDPESPVAAATLASHIEQIPMDAGAAISVPCKTENLGIEKMMANLISNPNIRSLVLYGNQRCRDILQVKVYKHYTPMGLTLKKEAS